MNNDNNYYVDESSFQGWFQCNTPSGMMRFEDDGRGYKCYLFEDRCYVYQGHITTRSNNLETIYEIYERKIENNNE